MKEMQRLVIARGEEKQRRNEGSSPRNRSCRTRRETGTEEERGRNEIASGSRSCY